MEAADNTIRMYDAAGQHDCISHLIKVEDSLVNTSMAQLTEEWAHEMSRTFLSLNGTVLAEPEPVPPELPPSFEESKFCVVEGCITPGNPGSPTKKNEKIYDRPWSRLTLPKSKRVIRCCQNCHNGFFRGVVRCRYLKNL
jgi:hypothetical protein